MDGGTWEDVAEARSGGPPFTIAATYALAAVIEAKRRRLAPGERADAEVDRRVVVLIALAMYTAARQDGVTVVWSARLPTTLDHLSTDERAARLLEDRPLPRRHGEPNRRLRGLRPDTETGTVAQDDWDLLAEARTEEQTWQRVVREAHDVVADTITANSGRGGSNTLAALHTPIHHLRIRSMWYDRPGLPPRLAADETDEPAD